MPPVAFCMLTVEEGRGHDVYKELTSGKYNYVKGVHPVFSEYDLIVELEAEQPIDIEKEIDRIKEDIPYVTGTKQL